MCSIGNYYGTFVYTTAMLIQDHVTNGIYLADRFLSSIHGEDAMETVVSRCQPLGKLSEKGIIMNAKKTNIVVQHYINILSCIAWHIR